jgi:predicted nucleic acid-binding Zn ribbon protein
VSDRGEPRRLRDSLAEVSAELGLGDTDAFTRLCERWPEVVGPGACDHSRPRSLRDGVLAVEVDDGAWATRLRTLERQVRERGSGVVSPGVIRGLRVTVSGQSSGTLRGSI